MMVVHAGPCNGFSGLFRRQFLSDHKLSSLLRHQSLLLSPIKAHSVAQHSMSAMLTRSKAATAEAQASRHPQANEAFKEGLCSVLRQWTALELALFHGWGGGAAGAGRGGSAAVEALQAELLNLFVSSSPLPQDEVYKDDVALILEDALEVDFNTVCEDGSPDELGELFCTMWRQCCVGDFSLVTDVLAKEYVRHEMVSRSQGLAAGDVDSDEEEDGEQGDGEARIQEAMQSIAEEDEGAMQMQEEEAPPLVDPEGWEVVGRSNKKNNKKKGYKI